MFVQQKQLSVLNVPYNRVALLYRSVTDVQIALPGLPSQMASAFLVLLKGGAKVQVLVALHLSKSALNMFYISDAEEVSADLADREFEAGLEFAESMGFVLSDDEFHRKSPEEQEVYWKCLPVCQKHTPTKETPVAQKLPTSVGPAASQEGRTASDAVEVKTDKTATSPPAAAPETVKQKEPATRSKAAVDPQSAPVSASEEKITKVKATPDELRQRLREHMGRFLSSL